MYMRFIRKDLVEIRYRYYENGTKEYLCVSKKDIDSLPVIELCVKDTAKWIPHLHGWLCSNCKSVETQRRNYCPECGSKMDNPYILKDM